MLTKSELKATIESRAGTCISMFLPTHRAGPEVEQDRIRLRNLLRRAEEELAARGMRVPQVTELLAPAHQLLEDGLFWEHQSDGLAVLVSPGVFRYYRVPVALDELVVVADRFHVKPLLSLVGENNHFYLLALSQNKADLYWASRHEIRPVKTPVVDGLADVLKYDEPERQLQYHTGTAARAGGRGRRAALFHGQGTGTDDTKDRILRYCREVDQAVRPHLGAGTAPLVLAAVEYLLPIYQQANTYPHLLDEGVPGNPDDVGLTALHSGAWEVVRPRFEEARTRAATRFGERLAGGHASADVKEVTSAACTGRVETLFVATGVQVWGAVDEESCQAELHEPKQLADEDLLDVAASETILHGGTVYAVDAANVPDDGPVAALYRY